MVPDQNCYGNCHRKKVELLWGLLWRKIQTGIQKHFAFSSTLVGRLKVKLYSVKEQSLKTVAKTKKPSQKQSSAAWQTQSSGSGHNDGREAG